MTGSGVFGRSCRTGGVREDLNGLNGRAKKDLYTYVPDAYWEEHRKEEVIPTQIVSDTADAVMDTSLKVNGVPEGTQSYHGMTALILHYYLGNKG